MNNLEYKYILVTIDDLDKVNYYGPFNDSEEASDWGLKNFDTDHTLSIHPIYSTVPKNYFVYRPGLN